MVTKSYQVREHADCSWESFFSSQRATKIASKRIQDFLLASAGQKKIQEFLKTKRRNCLIGWRIGDIEAQTTANKHQMKISIQEQMFGE